jgi:hypothetical protein
LSLSRKSPDRVHIPQAPSKNKVPDISLLSRAAALATTHVPRGEEGHQR